MQISNKRSVSLVVLCAVAAMLLVACGGGGGSSAPAPAAVVPTTGTVQITNNSTHPIDEVFVALSTSTTWGAKRNSSVVAAGTSWSLPGLSPATYDSMIDSIGATSTYYGNARGFSVTAGGTYTLTATNASFSGTLIVNNTNATFPITALYVSATALGAGPNQLSTSIAPGTARQIVNIPAGTYFVRAVQNGVNIDNAGVPIASYSFTNIAY